MELVLFAGGNSWVYSLSLPFRSGFGNNAIEKAFEGTSGPCKVRTGSGLMSFEEKYWWKKNRS